MVVSAMTGMGVTGFHRDQVHLPVANAALRLHRAGERADGGRGTLEDDGFEAVLMIEVHVHRRNDQLVAVVLRRHQAFGEVAFVMVVYI